LEFGQFPDLVKGVVLKLRAEALEDSDGFSRWVLGNILLKHIPFPGFQPTAVYPALLAKMDQKWFFGRNTAILNVTDNIPANTKALPKLTLRKIKGFSHSPDSVVHAIAPPFLMLCISYNTKKVVSTQADGPKNVDNTIIPWYIVCITQYLKGKCGYDAKG
jgi:hypothetical protein